MMNRIVLSLEIKVRSPFLFPGLAAAPFGLDACALRDADGNLLIPQDQVRGVLRHALAELVVGSQGNTVTDADFTLLFGKPSGDASADDFASVSNAPERGRLLFGDLAADTQHATGRAVRVEINSETRAAKEGHLMMVEQAAPNSVDVRFKGHAVLFATDEQAATWIPALAAATSYVSAIGAMKSAGFGEVTDFVVIEASRTPLAPKDTAPVPAERRRYKLTIDRPFLVDSHRAADNAYIGSKIIPGAAIKGLLARTLALCGQQPEKDDALSKLAIFHARPEGMDGPIPRSVVIAKDDSSLKVGDALQTPLDKGAAIDTIPGRFHPDWKESDKAEAARVLELHPGPDLMRDVRTHVAIEQKTGTAAESQLYVTSAVIPGGHAWIIDVDYSEIVDGSDRARLAAMLESGLDGLGRTGASISFLQSDTPPKTTVLKPVHWRPDAYAVILDTDAVMASPENGTDALEAYRQYWQRVCPDAELLNFFASQRLAGGYVALRGHDPDEGYRPFWLTEAGSVFLLAGDIGERLAKLAATGLPAPHMDGKELGWQRCIYQPENGYGRIRVDYEAALTKGVSYV